MKKQRMRLDSQITRSQKKKMASHNRLNSNTTSTIHKERTTRQVLYNSRWSMNQQNTQASSKLAHSCCREWHLMIKPRTTNKLRKPSRYSYGAQVRMEDAVTRLKKVFRRQKRSMCSVKSKRRSCLPRLAVAIITRLQSVLREGFTPGAVVYSAS